MQIPEDDDRLRTAGAFVRIRTLGREGKRRQATELVATFHTIPREMYLWGRWDCDLVRAMLRDHEGK